MTASLPAVLDRIEAGLDGARDRWFDLLRIPSVSAQPVHAGDCKTAAEWLRAKLAAIGFEAKVMPTAGHPVVLAHHKGTGAGAAAAVLRALRRAARRATGLVAHPTV